MYDTSDREDTRCSRRNEMTREEKILHQELVDLGRPDLAAAVADGRKYHRLEDLLGGLPPEFEGAVGLRLAFDPTARVPSSKEEWISEALVKYADDEDLQSIVRQWPVYREEAEAKEARIRKKKEAKAERKAAERKAAEREAANGQAANGQAAYGQAANGQAANGQAVTREAREAANGDAVTSDVGEAANGTTAGQNIATAPSDNRAEAAEGVGRG